ncbi:MAG: ACR3 family arsenite efflux transporter [Methanosphaera sp.]|uniref:ACR3 family arsenite efflux transporter n=1 Tax=Methanosphaera sp. BMS TaxID=1789762 RepID=UPI0019550DEF|nr:ACR3 family arsenite efflux transporter [Methanosphaera sp. BMS]MBQ6443764.1 ACR3 family arsenite efflux transporter [Methanosphaera sp.]MBR3213618.1 ACR3 family arsenite efflux transporter [Methanosphaera sp.]
MTDNPKISFFDKYLTIWVIICMIIGIIISQYFPILINILSKFEYAHISIPMAILIWIMIYPMMLKIDFNSIKKVKDNLRAILLTWCVNWLIQPFSMYLISLIFFTIIYQSIMTSDLATQYLIGAVLLGTAPCTAMVFVWSELTNGNPAYTLVQVATNDIIILFAYVPIVTYLLGISNITIPYDTLILSVILFVVIPFIASIITRRYFIKNKGLDYLENKFIPKFNNITTIGLLLTLIFIFSFQGNLILSNPQDIILIAIPFAIQIFLVFIIAYTSAKILKIPQDIAAPASMVGASNFFELAVAIAIALYGIASPVALATTVGVLIEVPLMLMLVRIINNTKEWYTS